MKGILDHKQKKELETSFNHFTLQDVNTPDQHKHQSSTSSSKAPASFSHGSVLGVFVGSFNTRKNSKLDVSKNNHHKSQSPQKSTENSPNMKLKNSPDGILNRRKRDDRQTPRQDRKSPIEFKEILIDDQTFNNTPLPRINKDLNPFEGSPKAIGGMKVKDQQIPPHDYALVLI